MDLTLSRLEEIRAAYGLRPGAAESDLDRPAIASGGDPSGAAGRRVSERVWRLSTSTGDVAVKLYAEDQLARAAKEAALVAHLNAHGDPRFRVQSLVRTAAGAPLWTGPRARAMVTAWAPGRARTYDTYTPPEWAALGAGLAALHASLEHYQGPLPDTLRARLAAIDADEARRELAAAPRRAPAHADRQALQAYADACLRLIDQHYPGSLAAFPTDDPQHPIHNDYNQFNYLFGTTLPPLILDWEAAIGAPREYEVVRCLNHLPLEAPALAAEFVHAYARVRPLRVERVAWAVDAACLQHGLKRWMLQGWLSDPARFATHLQGAMRMVAAMAGARAELIDFFSRRIEEGNRQGNHRE
ncbi:phosphotransferase enzyme family protein [Achromobacter aloeverae]